MKECYLPGRPGDCLPGRATPCWSAIYQGSLGTACLGECTPCQRKSPIYQGDLETACLGEPLLAGVLSTREAWELPAWESHSLLECYLPGKPGNCLPGRAHSLPEKECCLPEKPGTYLPGRNGSGEELFLPGKIEILEGKHYELTCLPACLLFAQGQALAA